MIGKKIAPTEHKGETGIATWRTIQYDNLRVRMVEYSSDYKADHWCSKGHVVFCVKGEFMSHMKDGSTYLLTKGMSYQTAIMRAIHTCQPQKQGVRCL